jgi:hypothetical protein
MEACSAVAGTAGAAIREWFDGLMNAEEVPSVAEELVRNGSRNLLGKPWIDRTHCLCGHEYTPENIVWRSHGARRCRICTNARNRRWFAEHGKALRRARRRGSEAVGPAADSSEQK